MPQITIHQAKSQLSRLLRDLESGTEVEFVIARGDRPVARLVALGSGDVSRRVGIARGQFDVPEPDPELDAIIARTFEGEP